MLLNSEVDNSEKTPQKKSFPIDYLYHRRATQVCPKPRKNLESPLGNTAKEFQQILRESTRKKRNRKKE